jgi:hypothetical protein
MFFTVILIWGLVIFANAVVYEILKPKDEIIVYKPINEVTEGFRQLEPPF